MENSITVHDLNLALTQRTGTAEPLFEAQRYFAEAQYRFGEDSEYPRGAANALMSMIALLTGCPEEAVREAVRQAYREGAYVAEIEEQEIGFYAEAWGITIEEARRRLRRG